MPQLDKYIFFSQIISLTFFFTLIYIFIRGTMVPKISKVLKYRTKKLNKFNNRLTRYLKHVNTSKVTVEKKNKKYLQFIAERLVIFIRVYKERSMAQITSLHNTLFTDIKNNDKILDTVIKNKGELKRFDSILK